MNKIKLFFKKSIYKLDKFFTSFFTKHKDMCMKISPYLRYIFFLFLFVVIVLFSSLITFFILFLFRNFLFPNNTEIIYAIILAFLTSLSIFAITLPIIMDKILIQIPISRQHIHFTIYLLNILVFCIFALLFNKQLYIEEVIKHIYTSVPYSIEKLFVYELVFFHLFTTLFIFKFYLEYTINRSK